MPRRGLISILVLLAIILCAFLALYFGYFLISPAGSAKNEEIFIVKKGSSLRKVAAELEERELIKSKDLFMMWAYLRGGARDIKAGEYGLTPLMAPAKIFNILTSGAVKTHPFTIPEGLTADQIADLLSKRNLVNKRDFTYLANDENLAASFHIDGNSLEGYLFPDTYLISRDMGAKDLVELMVHRFWDVFNALVKDKNTSMSVREIVTLASIVEKETGLAAERPFIASVFLNRLKKRMRLESIHHGLPPGPIANPGRESLMAVINPADTDYLYFVSKNDGSHYFSSSLKEHNEAVYKYQKRQRSVSGNE